MLVEMPVVVIINAFVTVAAPVAVAPMVAVCLCDGGSVSLRWWQCVCDGGSVSLRWWQCVSFLVCEDLGGKFGDTFTF